MADMFSEGITDSGTIGGNADTGGSGVYGAPEYGQDPMMLGDENLDYWNPATGSGTGDGLDTVTGPGTFGSSWDGIGGGGTDESSPWYQNPWLKMALKWGLRTNPLAQGLMTMYDMFAANGKGVKNTAAGTLGGAIGSGATGGNPLGGMLGAQAGIAGLNAIAQPMTPALAAAAPKQSSGSTQGQFGAQDYAQGLLGLYANHRMGQTAGRLAGGLGDMYGQSSPYAQQLRQTLQRSDAAAGRRSQSGTREVELQARLAGLQAQNAPNIFAARQGQDQAKLRNLQLLMNLGGAAWNQGVPQQAWQGAQDLYTLFNDGIQAG